MFSFLSGLSSSIYLYVIAALLAMTVLFGGLSWYLKGVADENKAALVVAVSANNTLQISLDKKTQSCDITDKQLADYMSQTSVIVQDKNTKLSAIDALPSKQVVKTTSSKVKQDETDVVDLDGKLPSSLIDLLHQSSSVVQGSVAVHP